jgi:ABC-type multidrug transport system ATPase subunit
MGKFMTQLDWHGVSFGYGGVELFEEQSLSVFDPSEDSGQVAVVLGSSGSGKSTFLKLSAGLLLPQKGSIQLLPEASHSAFLAQDAAIIDHLSAEENARLMASLKGTRSYFSNTMFDRASRRLAMTDLFAKNAKGGELSGGERQRVALIRALSTEPSLLFLDEPCRGLDHAIALEFLVDLRQLVQEIGLRVVMVTHDAEQARLVADHFIIVERERLVRLTSWPSQIAIGTPPSIECCRLLMSEPYTLLHGAMTDRQVKAIGTNSVLRENFERQSLRDGCVTVVVRASDVKWNALHGAVCREVRRNEHSSFAVCDNVEADEQSICIFGPGSERPITRFAVVGAALVYSATGDFLGTLVPRTDA